MYIIVRTQTDTGRRSYVLNTKPVLTLTRRRSLAKQWKDRQDAVDFAFQIVPQVPDMMTPEARYTVEEVPMSPAKQFRMMTKTVQNVVLNSLSLAIEERTQHMPESFLLQEFDGGRFTCQITNQPTTLQREVHFTGNVLDANAGCDDDEPPEILTVGYIEAKGNTIVITFKTEYV